MRISNFTYKCRVVRKTQFLCHSEQSEESILLILKETGFFTPFRMTFLEPICILLILILSFASNFSFAQENQNIFTSISEENRILLAQNENIQQDTSLIPQSSDTIKKEEKKGTFVMQKSTWGALIRSFVLPGWGQYYVESYWKVPIFLGATGFLVYLIIDNNNKYQDYQRQYDELKAQETNTNSFQLQLLKTKKEFYRDNRDMSAFYMLGVYILAAIDAYSDAHLYDFNVNDDLSLSVRPNSSFGVTFYLNFK